MTYIASNELTFLLPWVDLPEPRFASGEKKEKVQFCQCGNATTELFVVSLLSTLQPSRLFLQSPSIPHALIFR